MGPNAMRLRIVEQGSCAGPAVQAVDGLHCSGFACYGGPTTLSDSDFAWSDLRALAVGSYTVCICLVAPCGAAADYLAAGDLQILPGAYWEAETPFVTGEPQLITVVAPNRSGTFVVAPSCHGAYPSNISDAWMITEEESFDVNQTVAGDAEVCICGGICEAISPAIPAGLPGWDRVLVTPPPNPSYEVV